MLNKNEILNSPLETALRILMLLKSNSSDQLDVDEILFLDYFVLHINDFNSKLESIHPSIPNRENEIFIRRQSIQEAILLLESRKLIDINYTSTGIRYSSNDLTSLFVAYFESSYMERLKKNLNEINQKNISKLAKEIKENILSDSRLWMNGPEDQSEKER